MIDISNILKSLSNDRPIFHSEADLQSTLAWEIKKRNPDLDFGKMIPNQTNYKVPDLDAYFGKE